MMSSSVTALQHNNCALSPLHYSQYERCNYFTILLSPIQKNDKSQLQCLQKNTLTPKRFQSEGKTCLFLILQRRRDEITEQRMGFCRTGLEFRMELAAQEPGMFALGQLHNFNQTVVR